MGPSHVLNVHLATKYGVDEALMIHHFQYWISHNKRLKRNFIDNKTWTFQTIEEITAHFPYWSIDQVKRLLNKLVKKGVLSKNNFNKIAYDRTLWYAFCDESVFIDDFIDIVRNRQMEKTESPNGKDEIARPIPHTKTNTKTNSNIVPSVSDLAQHLFFKYNEFRKSLNLEMCDKTIITKNWNSELARLLKTHSKEKLIEIINFAFEDDFWKTVIESPAGLRKNMKKLETSQATIKKNVSSPEDNKEYAKSIELKFKKYTGSEKSRYQIEAFHTYFAIIYLGCQSPSFTLNYDVPNFKKTLDETLKQHNLVL